MRFQRRRAKTKLWRFSNVDLLDLSPFKFGGPVSDKDRDVILEQSQGLDEVAGRVIFAGDQLIERDVVSDELEKTRRYFSAARARSG